MPLTQVAHNRFADIDGDREKLVAVALPPDRDLTAPPVDVIDLQPGHLAAA
jgi:hypothetical protein